MLLLGVDPNVLYHSFLTKARLDDVFAAQGGRAGSVGPKNDYHLEEEIEREVTCRKAQWEFSRANNRLLSSMHIRQQYGPIEEGTKSVRERQQYWRWGALHLAVYRGDEEAVRLLLQYGANVHQTCSGVCDCLVPADGAYERRYRGAGMQHSVWTPMHISICQGHPEITKLLLDHEPSIASLEVGGYRLDVGTGKFHDMTAFHTAAIEGSMEALRFLLERHPGTRLVNRMAKNRYTALELAVLSGHIDTIVRELCTHPGRFQFGKGFRNPLADLCQRQLIDEATELFDLLEELRQSGEIKLRIDYRAVYSTALWYLCQFENIYEVKFGGWLSLRATQDMETARAKETELVLARRTRPDPEAEESVDVAEDRDNSAQDTTTSQEETLPTFVSEEEKMAIEWENMKPLKPARLKLAKALLDAGADPNFARPYSRWGPPLDSCLKVAIRVGFLEMVELLLENGARVDFRAYSLKDQAPVDVEDELVDLDLDFPICEAVKKEGPDPDDNRLEIFCILLEHGGLDWLSLEAKERMYTEAATINWAVGAWEELDRYFAVDNLSDGQMIRTTEKVAYCSDLTIEVKEESLDWLMSKYARRLTGPASASQRRLCEAIDDWSSEINELEGNHWDVQRKRDTNRLAHKVSRFLLANATIFVEE